MNLERLVVAMCDPAFYPEGTCAVELVQTHISYVFLTDRHVYKVKKPVNFGFLDYSTLEKRRHYCEREVALNARLCPDIYLGVVEITEDRGVFSLGGVGDVREYAVKMSRLPQRRMLREVLARGEGDAATFRRLAHTLAEFHGRAETSPEIAAMKGLEGVRFNCEENFQQTEKYAGRLLPHAAFEFIRNSTRLFLRRQAELFEARARNGRVRDGHGDLHLDSICVTDPICIFDCIEFNERFRYQDVAEEVAFLAMDLEFHNFSPFSEAFVDAYVVASGDEQLRELLDFYKGYRAYVRAKVNSFSTDDPHMTDDDRDDSGRLAARYYELAARYAARFNPQMLLVTCGLTGTGKSTVARKLGERYKLAVVRSDLVRKELLGVDAYERHYDAPDQGAYSREISENTYATMIEHAEPLLASGESVVLDGCFIKRQQREAASELASRCGVPILFLECQAPESLVRERLHGRVSKGKTVSDGRWEIYEHQREACEPPLEVPPECCIVLDRSRPVEEHMAALAERLPAAWGTVAVAPVAPTVVQRRSQQAAQ
jgi:uncharacterized protein